MIELTKLNGSKLVINSELIEFIESLPDSLITLTTGKKIMVREDIPQIIAAVVEFRRYMRSGDGYRHRGVPADGAQEKPKQDVTSPGEAPLSGKDKNMRTRNKHPRQRG